MQRVVKRKILYWGWVICEFVRRISVVMEGKYSAGQINQHFLAIDLFNQELKQEFNPESRPPAWPVIIYSMARNSGTSRRTRTYPQHTRNRASTGQAAIARNFIRSKLDHANHDEAQATRPRVPNPTPYIIPHTPVSISRSACLTVSVYVSYLLRLCIWKALVYSFVLEFLECCKSLIAIGGW